MIDPIAIQFGPFTIYWYAICIVTGLILAVYLATKEAPQHKIASDDVIDFILWAFPLSIIGARLYYVLFQWSEYASNPVKVFAIWEGGIAIYGGLLTGAISLFIFSAYRLIRPLTFLDVITPGVLLAQAIGRWGNFINQEAYGGAVSHLSYLPHWMREQMFIDGAYRQPTFLYESLWTFSGFLLLMALRHRPKFFKEGEITFFYMIWYGLGRFVIEGLRSDSLMFLGLRVSQWLSALLILVGLALFIYRRRQTDIAYYHP